MNVHVIYAEAPPSEVEWEELLVRYELGPRALRVALDDAPDDAETAERIRVLLTALVLNEMWVGVLFEAMRDGRSPPAKPRMAPQPTYERYAELRRRNFATVQRRGIEVWTWRTQDPGTVTAHQVILASTALDGETLAGIRQAARGVGAC
jgi:hypothetical protein